MKFQPKIFRDKNPMSTNNLDIRIIRSTADIARDYTRLGYKDHAKMFRNNTRRFIRLMRQRVIALN
jgi:hypothetical protein